MQLRPPSVRGGRIVENKPQMGTISRPNVPVGRMTNDKIRDFKEPGKKLASLLLSLTTGHKAYARVLNILALGNCGTLVKATQNS